MPSRVFSVARYEKRFETTLRGVSQLVGLKNAAASQRTRLPNREEMFDMRFGSFPQSERATFRNHF